MTTKTDFHALKELRSIYTPASRGYVTAAEIETISHILELDDRSDIELQNIRDMCVMLYSDAIERRRAEHDVPGTTSEMDAMSAICTVIDQKKVERNLEV